VLALDVEDDLLDFVGAVARRNPGLRVEARGCPLNRIGLDENSVDAAVAIFTVQIVAGPSSNKSDREVVEWLRSVRRAVRPGGRFAIIENSGVMNPEFLERMLAQAGFRDLLRRPLSTVPTEGGIHQQGSYFMVGFKGKGD